MLNPDDNELICRVGPGTPMNKMMKRYWMPAILASEVPEPDGAPKRIRLLGEDYVLFRDTDGRIGLLDAACCHRGASLTLGRVEECGIRCIYHGWKFDVDGNVVETPNIPDDRIKRRLRIGSYKLRESCGLVWVYLGPRDQEPPFPHFPFMDLPANHTAALRAVWPCNWVQAMESSIDSSHFGFLHKNTAGDLDGGAMTVPSFMRKPQILTADDAPVIQVRDTEFGFHYAALRKVGDGRKGHGVRVTSCVFPNGFVVPPGTQTCFYVPYDDYHTAWVMVAWDPAEPINYDEAAHLYGLDRPELLDANGYFDMTPGNNFRQDRDYMARGSFSGLPGITAEDAGVVASMGRIVDRRVENLVSSDLAIVRLRQLLLESVRRVERGEDPLCVNGRGVFHASSLDVYVEAGESWQTVVPKHREVADIRRLDAAE